MALIEVEGLSITLETPRGRVHAVRNIDLSIERGAIHGLIGESGCGKTITGMALPGCCRAERRLAPAPSALMGKELRDTAASLHGSRIAMISQDPAAALNPVLSIGRQMDDVLRCHRNLTRPDRRSRAVELLAATGLPDPAQVLKSYPHQLSGGMQQRVVIAQALATGAEFLIADEPTTALDVTIGAQVLALLRRLVAERGLTVLMITHDMDVVAECCDRASVLYAGNTVEEGPTTDLLTRPRHPYPRALLAALPTAAAKGHRLASVEGQIPSPATVIKGCAFAPRCSVALAACHKIAPPRRGNAARVWLCHRVEAPA